MQWPDPDEVKGITEHQRECIATAFKSPISLIGGNPGVGKSYVAGAIIDACEIHAPMADGIAACAFTGKAANRLKEILIARNINIKATTIHRLLGPQRNGHDGDGWHFEHTASNPLPYDYIFCDELSMNDTSIMSNLLCAVRDDACFLGLGDVAQLPPVGHGAPLRDMIAAGIPYGELTEPHRNGGDILRVCAELKARRPYLPSVGRNLANGENVWHFERSSARLSIAALQTIIADRPPDIDPITDIQVLCAVNDHTPASREMLNVVLQNLLNGEGERYKGMRFRLGDKVICRSNQFLPLVACPECKQSIAVIREKGKFICWACQETWGMSECQMEFAANGEIGFVTWGAERDMHVKFDAPDRTVRVAGEQLDSFQLAYAISCHSSQGSEWPVVITMVDDSRPADHVTSMEWWRTACSRAKQIHMTIGSMRAINRQSKRSALQERKTFLASLIGENHG